MISNCNSQGTFFFFSISTERSSHTRTFFRPLDVWFMDISKQAISSVFIHFWNITFSIFFAKTVFEKSKSEFGVGENSDECAFYFLCFLFDTILGVFLVWMLLRISYRISIYFRIDSIKVQGF